MSRSVFSDKANVLCILRVLEEYSDENHILPMRELIAKIEALYGTKLDRRTVYGAISLLLDFGYDISLYEENRKGYYLRKRIFESGEVRVLMDAVNAFPFLPPNHTKELIEKLQQFLSVYQRKKVKHLKIIHGPVKTENRQILYSVEQLDEAISKKVKVKFTYMQYNTAKKLTPRRSNQYTVNPYGMVYQNEHYYLICTMAYQENVSLYRIDKMKDIALTEYPLDKRAPDFDPKEFVSQAIYAFSGAPQDITLLCERHVLDHVIDRFGTGIRIEQRDSDMLKVQLKASPEGVKFWALQFLPYVEVKTPQWLRDEIVESIEANKYKSEETNL